MDITDVINPRKIVAHIYKGIVKKGATIVSTRNQSIKWGNVASIEKTGKQFPFKQAPASVKITLDNVKISIDKSMIGCSLMSV